MFHLEILKKSSNIYLFTILLIVFIVKKGTTFRCARPELAAYCTGVLHIEPYGWWSSHLLKFMTILLTQKVMFHLGILKKSSNLWASYPQQVILEHEESK